jgi:hypothetical protein
MMKLSKYLLLNPILFSLFPVIIYFPARLPTLLAGKRQAERFVHSWCWG